METETGIVTGIIIGIVGTLAGAIILYFFNLAIFDKIFAKIKYRKFIGKYTHDRGRVEINHIRGNNFQAIGTQNDGPIWISNLHYIGNLGFTGVYDWKPDFNLNDWGEHYLHVLPNCDISVIWTNKSVQTETRGRLIWKKEKE
jgi:hypothetical protein